MVNTVFGENGGFNSTGEVVFVPVQDLATGAVGIYTYDTTDFDDELDGCFYTYRAEDIEYGAVPTVRRVIIAYRDLGEAQITVEVTGTNDDAEVVVATTTVDIGNTVPTGAIMTAFADLELTGFRPQVTWIRGPGSGPVSIISLTMVGEVEEATL